MKTESICALVSLLAAANLLVGCGNDPNLLDPADFAPSAIPFDPSSNATEGVSRPQDAAANFAWVSISWPNAPVNSAVNLDLHVVDPSGEEINLTNTVGDHGRFLEHRECVSYDCSGDESDPRETVFWQLRNLPPGQYRAWVENISERSGSFEIGIVFGGHREEGSGSVGPGERSREWTWTVDSNDCLRQLMQLGVKYEETNISEGSCTVDDGVMVYSPLNGVTYRVDAARSTTRFRTSCETALALHRYGGSMRGQGITEAYHDGSFRCRNINGSNRLSTHGLARAMDFRGFGGNGRTYSVLSDWDDPEAGPVLRNLATAGQGIFQTVLTPDSNADHADHFHMDIGR